jgi:phosphohistidine swiveling domain-containing protein
MINIENIKKENYQRAFSFKNLGCLFIDVACSWYKRRNFLAVYQDEMCDQYFENSMVEKTLQNGKEIFSSERNFKVFEAAFRAGIIETANYLEKAKSLQSVTLNDFFDLRALAVKMFYFFEKTEFLFTDSCYAGEMNDLLKKNLLILGDDLKMTARPLMVELLTTIPYRYTEIIAKENDLDPEDLKSYTLDEISTLIELKKSVSSDVISERKKSFVIYCENESLFILDGKDKETVLQRFKAVDTSKTSEFKGIIANKGKITAKVRVIVPELDQKYELFVKKLLGMEMYQGEILVTETTSPDFVPLMKKAGGIIANQGGLNSHAAIMSRELKVPCLVGTYVATDILKTGDTVELDADNGIVRIIQRA